MTKHFLFLFMLLIWGPVWALKPDKNYVAKPEDLSLTYTANTITTRDGYVLQSWAIAPNKENDNKTTLIVAYGDSGNMSYWLNQAWVASNNGYTVVLFDYRGFGKSQDFNINNDYLYYNEFATDLEAVIEWTKVNQKNTKTGIWALSMGTIMTNLALQKQKVDFVIAEGLVYDPSAIASKIKQVKNKTILLPDTNFDIKKLSRSITCPYLLIAGKQDKMTTSEDSKLFSELAKGRQLIEFDGNHLEGFTKLSGDGFGAIYMQKIQQFINP
ncbi:alpha/beta hydrolase [Flavobacterium cerinum]|uniref:Alpha/beta hydrolase n=1 Tax=Flavobacterium cerinum TaxID=2502784 RepID=A0ABY5IQI4_9FLAO|nr:alpha/beta hydrolase [Flavobacterium cerinum]UUC45105.1 alpha/beta hydrolase [Flavobacterium cerinum]